MQNRHTLKIKMKPYLKAFIVHVHGKGSEPVFVPKKDPISRFLNHSLIKRPVNVKEIILPDEDYIELILPFFEWHSPLVYNYMTGKTEVIFENLIQDIFWVTFTRFSNEKFLAGIPTNLVPHLYIAQYELPDDESLENNLVKYIYRHQSKFVKSPIRNYSSSNS